MANLKSLEQLVNMAVVFDKKILVHYALSGKNSFVFPYKTETICNFEKSYNINDGVLTFIYKGKQHLIPNIEGAKNLLLKEGFEEKDIYVPFGFFKRPVAKKYQWDELLELKNKN